MGGANLLSRSTDNITVICFLDTGGLSKAAKKNKKKNERKKKASGATSTNPKGKPTPPHRPVDLLPLLKEELEVAKSAQVNC